MKTALVRFIKTFWGSPGAGWRLARVVLLLAAGIIFLVMAFEDKLIYFPSKYPEGVWDVGRFPARQGEAVPRIEDCYFTTSDGVRLHGWYATPQRLAGGELHAVSSEMVLLWFHGNAGNITHRYDMIKMLAAIPADVFIIDYRGYGRSEGTPSEQGLYKDALAAWDYLTGERGVAARRIVLFGKSLGGVAAIDLATRVEPAGLIVQSSFTSAADMAAQVLPFFPALFLRTKMDSVGKIVGVRAKKLFIHSRADEVVPYALGRRLYEAAPEPKQLYEVEGALHNETYVVGGKAYLEALRDFVNSCAPTEQR